MDTLHQSLANLNKLFEILETNMSYLNSGYFIIEAYDRIKRYSAREIFFNLYSVNEAAQNWYSLYQNITKTERLKFRQISKLNNAFKKFKDICSENEIVFTLPTESLKSGVFNLKSSTSFDIIETKKKL